MSGGKKQDVKGEDEIIQNGSDGDLTESLEDGVSDSDSNNAVYATYDSGLNSERDLGQFFAGGREVKENDVLIIEQLPDEICHEQNSDEELATPTFYEYQCDFDEENCDHLPQAYFDNKEKLLRSQQKARVLNIEEIHSLSKIRGNEKDEPVKNPSTKVQAKALTGNADTNSLENPKTILSAGSKKKLAGELKMPLPEMRFDPSEIFKNPFIYEIAYVGAKDKNLIPDNWKPNVKCPDYNSDEFADIEDNLKEDSLSSDLSESSSSGTVKSRDESFGATSLEDLEDEVLDDSDSTRFYDSESTSEGDCESDDTQVEDASLGARPNRKRKAENLDRSDALSCDNNESFTNLSGSKNIPFEEATIEVNLNQYLEVEILDGRKDLKNIATESFRCSNNELTGNKVLRDKLEGLSPPDNLSEPSCSYAPQNKRTKAFSTDKIRGMKKVNMDTIVEVPELEEEENNQKVIQPAVSKTNPLKMKSKVGNRKDKCNVCNVRLGLCAIRCRCGGYYCAKHRYDKEHNCTFDYKTMGAEEIRKNNPRIVAEKIRKL